MNCSIHTIHPVGFQEVLDVILFSTKWVCNSEKVLVEIMGKSLIRDGWIQVEIIIHLEETDI